MTSHCVDTAQMREESGVGVT